ncbi:phosphoenolpyruvate--protein phosphotransferase [Photobacterium damselae]|uniref:phosphoenolpyruvate--protein phosphotransferase n=1 Tax=Photobacterium damselae TaxID=38293 RepID=A0ABD6X2D5_PHODM|nr:phosphoenolpyruvate--protein phosphotransferase [Photobacterium damselae]OBU40779.1 phosphoenolpyruvate--protein phosphotransferase PtsP [Photobacterium damselae]PSU16644.1 phosphoenolpyruvate-protein phosphotransferase PtsP [Photobacterium damselae]
MLAQLREIVEKVVSASNLIDALDQLVIQTCLALDAECCSIYIADHGRREYTLMATKGLHKQSAHVALKFDEGLVGLVGRKAEPVNVADAHNHPEFKHLPDIGEERFASFFGTPIIHQRQVLGVLVIQQRCCRVFDESEESFMVTLAAQIATILAHAKAQGMWPRQRQGMHYTGVVASTGIAVAKAWWDDTQPQLESVQPAFAADITQEQERLSIAIDKASAEFRRLRKRFDNELQKETLAIFDLFSHLLNDPMLRKDLFAKINAGDLAEWAVRQVVEDYSARFAQMRDEYLKERAQDLRELGQRLLYFLSHDEVVEQKWDEPIVLLTRELTAAMLASIPTDKLAAVVAQEGAANSHAAILSRTLGVPAIMGVDFVPESAHNKRVIVDGYRGEFTVQPNRLVLKEYRRLLKEEQELTQIVSEELARPAITSDGCKVQTYLNTGLNSETCQNLKAGIDGVGLYRTEVPFLLQHSFPSEDEQRSQYHTMLTTYAPMPVVMRTLDIGGDKPLPYLPIEEDNPFLGWRGIRFTLDHPEIFTIQVRAMLQASIGLNNLDILLPMISSVGEIEEAKELIDKAYQDVLLQAQGRGLSLSYPRIGIMIEVPSMLYQLDALQGRVDFISVGSNDLTQYLLAVDRNNARVASVYDPLHPAVLHALHHIVQSSNRLKIPVSLCGELAGDPLGAVLLVGMGYRSLSMNTRSMAKIKYMLKHLTIADMESLAQSVLSVYFAQDVRVQTVQFLEHHGLGGLVRAGKF